MEKAPKVTIRLNASGGLLDVDVDGQQRPTELVEEQESEPVHPVGDHNIQRNWLAPG